MGSRYTFAQDWLVRLPMGSPRGRSAAKRSSPGNHTIRYSAASTPAPPARI